MTKFARDNATNRVWLWATGPIVCKTDAYRPAVFTAQDDNSTGEILPNSTGTPSGTYAQYNLLAYNTGTSTSFEHIHSRYGYVGLETVYTSGNTIRDCQLINCGFGAIGSNGSSPPCLALRNVLIDKPSTAAIGGGTTSITAENVTLRDVNQVLYLFDANCSLMLTNSIIAGVTNTASTYTNVTGAYSTSSAGFFQSVAGGNSYLAAGSPYRGIGTTNIEARLLSRLSRTTTYPPTLLTNAITVTTVLSPQVQRNSGLPDYGYHYDPLDYTVSGVAITNATLILTNGVAIGTYGSAGLYLDNGAKLFSEGAPTQLVRLGHVNRVQEQPSLLGGTGNDPWLVCRTITGTRPEIHLRHSDYSALSAGYTRYLFLYLANYTPSVVEISNCYLRNAWQNIAAFASGLTLTMQNNLLERNYWTFIQDTTNNLPFTFTQANNLLLNGSAQYYYYNTNSTWNVIDTLFDCDALYVTGSSYNCANNGYRSGLAPATFGVSAKTNLVLTFQAGAMTNTLSYLGQFYYPPSGWSTSVFDAGSRTAPAAGLYHYTIRTDQTKETNTIVDIGFHYVALDTNGNPNDWDSDGSPDYWEDYNGNGAVDSGETNWQDASDLGLRVLITQPKANSNVP